MKLCPRCEAGFEGNGWRCPACGFEPDSADGIRCFAPALAAGGRGDAVYDLERITAVEERHFWYRSRAALLVHVLARHFPAGGSFLELGCGTGFLLSRLRSACPGWRLTGSDPVIANLARARSRVSDASFLQLDAREIPFRDEFDVIGAFDVLEHIADDGAALARIFAALKPGGGVVLTVPQHRFLWSSRDEWSHHERRYRRRELLDKLAGAGFRCRRWTSFVSLLMPLLWLSRRLDRGAPEEVDPGRELAVAPLANAALGAVMTLERGLIRLGAALPAGASLLVVAQRPLAAGGAAEGGRGAA